MSPGPSHHPSARQPAVPGSRHTREDWTPSPYWMYGAEDVISPRRLTLRIQYSTGRRRRCGSLSGGRESATARDGPAALFDGVQPLRRLHHLTHGRTTLDLEADQGRHAEVVERLYADRTASRSTCRRRRLAPTVPVGAKYRSNMDRWTGGLVLGERPVARRPKVGSSLRWDGSPARARRLDVAIPHRRWILAQFRAFHGLHAIVRYRPEVSLQTWSPNELPQSRRHRVRDRPLAAYPLAHPARSQRSRIGL